MKKFPYKVGIDKRQQRGAEEWCRENFGPEWLDISNTSGTWCCFWAGFRNIDHNYIYHFINKTDAVMFSLRWS
jgi:hypothetical protein